MMMPGYDRESKNDGGESIAKGFAKGVYEYKPMVIRFWPPLNYIQRFLCSPLRRETIQFD